jgi:hypothetical protein
MVSWEVFVSLHRFQLTIITLGFTAPIAVLGIRLALGSPVTVGLSLALLLAGCVPAAVMLTVFRGAPPRTIAQVLYDTDRTTSPELQPIAAAAESPEVRQITSEAAPAAESVMAKKS